MPRLRALLFGEGEASRLFDAFLVAAALQQVLADYLHRGGGVRSLGRFGVAVRTRIRRERKLAAWEDAISELVHQLARAVVSTDAATAPRLAQQAEFLRDAGAFPRDLRRSVVRLPHCFRSFDMHPEDCRRLVKAFSIRHPDRAQPLLVVGLRTAGSYLGPLCAASLEEEGYADVRTITLRPGERWLEHDTRRLAEAASARRLALVVDEPPRTGTQLARAAAELERAGFVRESVTLLVPLFESRLPAPLSGYETVTLPWAEWAVQRRLTPRGVEQTLDTMLRGRTVTVATDDGGEAAFVVRSVEGARPLAGEGAKPLAGGAGDGTPRRGHVRAAYQVQLVDDATGERVAHEVCVEGAGLGYLGRHALVVASGLDGFTPEVYGLREGLLYRAWLPESWRLSAARLSEEPVVAERVASYVLARTRALAVPRDTSQRLVWREAVWELAADLLAKPFGRAEVLLRPAISFAARRLLLARTPAVVDGSMALSHWFAPPFQGHEAQKVDFGVRAFSNHDRYCYDPIFDLAGAAASAALDPVEEGWPEGIRQAWEELAGEPVASERWLVYQLLHHRDTHEKCVREFREGRGSERVFRRLVASERGMSSACLRYLDESFRDHPPARAGALCGIDIDWVLEARWLFFPAPSPAGMLAIRALTRHGYRPVIASGRSLGEVRERCAHYGMAGGVAEYGAALYDHLSGRARDLLETDERVIMEELRTVLRDLPGVFVDPAYRHSIRAYEVAADGTRGLDPESTARALERCRAAERVRAISSRSQTDFVPARIDKGTGLVALAGELGGPREHRGEASLLALAVGDSSGDLPMLELAARRFAPANAEASLLPETAGGLSGIEIVRRPVAAGLLEAVARFLGHDPAGCNVCQPRRRPSRDALLLHAVLQATGDGRRERLRSAAQLVAHSRR
ncbi:MAG: hypothetical protein M3312_07605 [Actinomycetota bacterium]|nr:hypothetical protein [Actinomycetota bacterium]